MSLPLGMSRAKFPFYGLPYTVEEYYKDLLTARSTEDKSIFDKLERVKQALASDEDFKHFWEKHCEGQPEAEVYLSGSTTLMDPQYVSKVSDKYLEFLQNRDWSDIPASVRERVESAFDEYRPALYKSFLVEEAARLNCDVLEVRPKVEVLPLGGESKLGSLPDDIVARILGYLETIEILRVSQVCRNWRNLVLNRASMLTRVEHSLTTHLLIFTKWMDPSNIVKSKDFIEHYQSFGWGLIKWCSNISQNLDTLVLHELNRPSNEVMDLLRQCPNLRHLRLRFSDKDNDIKTDFQLPKLETLIIDDSDCMYTSKLVVNAFTTSNILGVFKDKLYLSAIISINKKDCIRMLSQI